MVRVGVGVFLTRSLLERQFPQALLMRMSQFTSPAFTVCFGNGHLWFHFTVSELNFVVSLFFHVGFVYVLKLCDAVRDSWDGEKAKLVKCLLSMPEALGWIPNIALNQVWLNTLVISALQRWRQEDQKFQVICR